jgi:hypothetical protein
MSAWLWEGLGAMAGTIAIGGVAGGYIGHKIQPSYLATTIGVVGGSAIATVSIPFILSLLIVHEVEKVVPVIVASTTKVDAPTESTL